VFLLLGGYTYFAFFSEKINKMIRRTKKISTKKILKKTGDENAAVSDRSVKLPVKISKRKTSRKNALALEKNVHEVEDRILRPEIIAQGEYVKDERKKAFIMWSGVCFFMILIFAFWIYNAKQVFQTTKTQNADQEKSLDDLKSISGEIEKQMNSIKETIGDLKNAAAATTTPVTSSSTEQDQNIPTLPVSESVSGITGGSTTSTSTIVSTSTDATEPKSSGTNQ
jgi:hypothetical protein